MKLRLCLFLAAISALLAVAPARTARRPRYGGTLHVELADAVNSLEFDASGPEAGSAAAELRDLIYSRASDGGPSKKAMAGPFRVADWQPGRRVQLAANEEYAGGRPFVDSIEIVMGRSAKERLLDLELGKTDVAEIPAEEARRAAERGVRLNSSRPDELVALVFVPGRPLAEDARAREALARVIDRASIADFILQKEAEPAGGLLPQWSSGTAFLFSTSADPSGAKEQWSQIPGPAKISVGYDAGDTMEEAIAERIAVNAHEAGMAVGTTALGIFSSSSAKTDARVVRLRMESSKPREALAEFLGRLAPLAGIHDSVPPENASAEDTYACERAVVSSFRVIPIVWLPDVYGLSSRVRDWKAPEPGENWPLADVWLDDSVTQASSK